MAAAKKSGPLTHLDDVLDQVYDAHSGLGGDLNFLNTVFTYLRRKTTFFQGAKSAKQVAAMAQKHRERALRDAAAQPNKKRRTEQKSSPTPAEESTPVPKPTPAAIEVVEDEPEPEPEPAATHIPDADTPAGDSKDAPVGNGGSTDKYTWTQTLKEVVVSVPVPEGTRGRDLEVKIHQASLKISLVRPPAGADSCILDGRLHKIIDVDASTWTLENDAKLGRIVNLYMLKINNMEWWDCVLEGDEKIDTTKIVPENSKLNDLDPSTRSTVEKMMFDQRAKAAGQPTSDERRRQDMLSQFMKQHPEMDFSKAKFM